jgi:hypothetical protein
MRRSLPLLSPSVVRLPLTLLLIQLAIIPVEAQQVQAPECWPATMGIWNWVRLSSSVQNNPDNLIIRWQTYNSLNQSPCQTAAYLAAQCNNERTSVLPSVPRGNLADTSPEFTIPQLAQGNHYTGPSGSDAGDICRCNSVYYSLISACIGCQKGIWISYVLAVGTSCFDSC